MKPITDIGQLDLTKRYTYADYLTWQFTDRVELLMGKIFKMSPAPTSSHQHAVSVIHGTIFQFLKGKTLQSIPRTVRCFFTGCFGYKLNRSSTRYHSNLRSNQNY
ncbi:MAG: hypothetical protein U5K54_17780 [Cytophagales bacterium]|nr:hypothetical protein [Cytophagales bacterium]